MATNAFLAMTAAEIAFHPDLPPKIGWMACHFSPYGTGLSNLPQKLPENSLLILNDLTPIHGHDPERITQQLTDCIEQLDCMGLLLDFQRPDCEEAAALVKHLHQALPCPVAVSDLYAREPDCPVFLPPVPPSVALTGYLLPWKGRDIWLEIGLDGEEIRLTENGCDTTALPRFDCPDEGMEDRKLHCHYSIAVSEQDARFTLWRTQEDLKDLLAEAENLGVTTAVGLWQELRAPE